MSENMKAVGVIIILSCIVELFSSIITWGFVTESWEKSTIERGFSQHNQITGQWEWKEEVSDE